VSPIYLVSRTTVSPVRHLLSKSVTCPDSAIGGSAFRIRMFRESDQPFANRRHAGAELAAKLKRYAGRDDVVVLALPRGGVPVAFEVAEALDAELDIFLVPKHADRLRTGGHQS
jgi:orotate phosphoribosyltransferase-like protein